MPPPAPNADILHQNSLSFYLHPQVRHGLMMIGGAGSAKSTIVKLLAAALPEVFEKEAAEKARIEALKSGVSLTSIKTFDEVEDDDDDGGGRDEVEDFFYYYY